MANDTMNRRNFLEKALGATAALAVVPAVVTTACNAFAGGTNQPLGSVVLNLNESKFNKLKNVNGSVVYPGDPNSFYNFVITKISASTFMVVSARCTHLNCIVSPYDTTSMRISCGCHGSQFDINGVVKGGPAGQSLKQYQNTYDATLNTLTITDSSLEVLDNKIGILSLSSYPNPASDKVTLEVTLNETEKVKIYLIDASGKKLSDIYEGLLTQGKSTHSIVTSNIPTGSYLLIVETENGSLTRGIQVLH